MNMTVQAGLWLWGGAPSHMHRSWAHPRNHKKKKGRKGKVVLFVTWGHKKGQWSPAHASAHGDDGRTGMSSGRGRGGLHLGSLNLREASLEWGCTWGERLRDRHAQHKVKQGIPGTQGLARF